MTKYYWGQKSLGLLLLYCLVTVNAVRVQQAGKLVRGESLQKKIMKKKMRKKVTQNEIENRSEAESMLDE